MAAAVTPAVNSSGQTVENQPMISLWNKNTPAARGTGDPGPLRSSPVFSGIPMSLYHETAALLSAPTSYGGTSLKSRAFGSRDLKSPPAQVYALALESCKWSRILKEVIENAELLRNEHKLTPALSLLLVHDLLISKQGVALPLNHGLRATVRRHQTRLSSELTRARIRRECSSLEALRALVEAECGSGEPPPRPRWIRVNTLKTTVAAQLETTFAAFKRVPSVRDVAENSKRKVLFVDIYVPNLVAVAPGIDVTTTDAYKTGAIILQDKASCFPAYLLDPQPEDGDVIDSCAAPGNKTTHLAAILQARNETGPSRRKIHAFEKNKARAATLEQMVKRAGSDGFTHVHHGQDFLKVDPTSKAYKNVGALLLDPSCSGSGMVGRDDLPKLHLPNTRTAAGASVGAPGGKGKHGKAQRQGGNRKRKRDGGEPDQSASSPVALKDDGENTSTILDSDADLQARIAALASFQLALLQHAFSFPSARKVTYSTCSVHAGENEEVVMRALASDVARERGWRLLSRARQVRGMREWPVRGSAAACSGNHEIAEACIRAESGDGQGTMGFFVAAFCRDTRGGVGRDENDRAVDDGEREGSIDRDRDGWISRDALETSTFEPAEQNASGFGDHGGGSDPPGRGADGEGANNSGSQGFWADGSFGRPPRLDSLDPDTLGAYSPAARRGRDRPGDVTTRSSENEGDSDDEWTGFAD